MNDYKMSFIILKSLIHLLLNINLLCATKTIWAINTVCAFVNLFEFEVNIGLPIL